MKTNYFLGLGCIAALIFCLHSCESASENFEPEPEPEPEEVENTVINKAVFSGYVQKGPFYNGSSVTISELNENLDQTGKTYFTNISDNLGSFEKKNIDLISNYILLKADGYFFNEVSGEMSNGQITLNTIVDVKDVSAANVNVLTHMERARVEYLVQQESLDFSEAKRQARKEVLAIFGFSLPEATTFESLNLTNDAILLAVSCILQGACPSVFPSPNFTGEMASLMADISTNIRVDGKLDNEVLKRKLIINAYDISVLDNTSPWYNSLSDIRKNLNARYTELGYNITVPDFESYVQAFKDFTFDPTAVISYPETGAYGLNILSDAVTSISCQTSMTDPLPYYSIKADIPLGLSLRIIMKAEKGSNGNPQISDWGSNWLYRMLYEPDLNWCFDFSQEKHGLPSDLKIGFSLYPVIPDQFVTIEFYENNATTPTKVKKLYLEK